MTVNIFLVNSSVSNCYNVDLSVQIVKPVKKNFPYRKSLPSKDLRLINLCKIVLPDEKSLACIVLKNEVLDMITRLNHPVCVHMRIYWSPHF